jgi:hypothetical protein
MYNALRKACYTLVAIEFKYKGTVWRVDTPEEAVRLRNELQKSDRAHIDAYDEMDESAAFWTPDRFTDVINGIGELQHRFLIAIYRHKPGAITSGQLVSILGLRSEVALAGVISGLSKQLKQIDIEPTRVFLIRVSWTGKKKTRTFILEDFFAGAGIDLNWPDAWERGKGKHAVEKPGATSPKKRKGGQR